MPAMDAGIRKVKQIAADCCAQLGYQLFDVSLDKEHTGRYLRIYIDTDRDGGIDLDDCEKFHRAVQPKVEDYDYDFLEVCSPGADRPVRDEKEAKKYAGYTVDVRLYKTFDGRKEFCLPLIGMDTETVTLESENGPVQIPRSTVSVIRLHPDLSALDEE